MDMLEGGALRQSFPDRCPIYLAGEMKIALEQGSGILIQFKEVDVKLSLAIEQGKPIRFVLPYSSVTCFPVGQKRELPLTDVTEVVISDFEVSDKLSMASKQTIGICFVWQGQKMSYYSVSESGELLPCGKGHLIVKMDDVNSDLGTKKRMA